MRQVALIAGLAVAALAGAAAGYALHDPEPEIVTKPVPGPTKTVVKMKRVEVEVPPVFSLVPLRTPLSLPAPRRGIPRRTSLVPRRAEIEKFLRVPAASGLPPQLVVAWRKRAGDFDEALGLLLWQLDRTGPRTRWRVVFGIHEGELGCDRISSFSSRYFSRRRLEFHCGEYEGVLVGPPLEERTEKLFCGGISPFIGVSLEDLTSDGHQDVFVAEGGCGSGGVTVWRILASSAEGTEQVFRHVGADTTMRLVDGSIRVRAAVYREGDSHCCPSFFRKYTLLWDGARFVRTGVRLVPARF
ncbi:MAG: hypothetical protein M3271_12220 [Actinomycetota bacterium]|nr:hypothetical protein [Actinomycetota bacterium]